MDKFDYLVKALLKNGYEVKIEKDEIYDFARVSGKNIRAAFCTEHDRESEHSSYLQLNGKISADHVDCFDKWSICPLTLELPSNETELNFLLEQLKYWGTEEGYKVSDSFDYIGYEVSSYPK